MCDSMKILFAGDSYTYGTGLLDANNTRFSKLISQHYNSEEINIAVSGVGNDYIIMSTVEFLEQNRPDLCVIQLSDSTRVMFASSSNNNYNVLKAKSTKNSIEDKISRYLFSSSVDNMLDWYRLTRYKIVTLDAYLELKQIKRIYCVKSKSEIRYFLEDISLPEKIRRSLVCSALNNIPQSHKVSLTDPHPNELGHIHIAKMLIQKIDDIL